MSNNKPLLFQSLVVILFPETKASWFNNQRGKKKKTDFISDTSTHDFQNKIKMDQRFKKVLEEKTEHIFISFGNGKQGHSKCDKT